MSNAHRLLGAICVLGALACGGAADDAVELAAEGGAKRLREPLRPAKGPPRVLIFALDGVGDAMLRESMDAGDLPSLDALLGQRRDSTTFDHGIHAGPVLSVLPSITLAAWTTILTGTPPAESGVPGNEWYDRASDRFFAPAPVSVSGREHALRTLSDGLLDSLVAVPTLFERADVRSYVSLHPLHRGADLLALPGLEELVDMLAAFPEGVAGEESVEREAYASLDRSSAGAAADLVRAEGAPDLMVVYFPGIDLYTHAAPRPLSEQRRYLTEVTNAAMADVLAAYRGAGALRGTWVLILSDHGHTPVPADPPHALATDSGLDPASVLESAGFRVRPFELESDGTDHQAVLAYQGAFAFLSLADRSTCPDEGDSCEWPRPPRREEDVLPAARALARAAATHPAQPLDLVLLRARGGGLEVLAGEEVIPLDEALRRDSRPELLRFRERLGWLVDGSLGGRAGDVILMSRLGASVAPEERSYFSHPYHSWHGSAEAQDSHTPLLVARMDADAEEIRSVVTGTLGAEPTQLGLTPLVLDLLSGRRR